MVKPLPPAPFSAPSFQMKNNLRIDFDCDLCALFHVRSSEVPLLAPPQPPHTPNCVSVHGQRLCVCICVLYHHVLVKHYPL